MNVNYLLPRRLLGYKIAEDYGYAVLYLAKEASDVVGLVVGRDRYDNVTVPLESFVDFASSECLSLVHVAKNLLNSSLNKQIFIGVGSPHSYIVGLILRVSDCTDSYLWFSFPESEEEEMSDADC